MEEGKGGFSATMTEENLAVLLQPTGVSPRRRAARGLEELAGGLLRKILFLLVAIVVLDTRTE